MSSGMPPKQERSRRTLERTICAIEELLRNKPFEAISIEEIVEAAGSSVGSFYARFKSKDGVLPHLYERYDADLRRRVDEFIAGREWAHRTIEEQAKWFANLHFEMYQERRWLMRAVGLFARQEPSPLTAALRKSRSSLHGRIVATFEPHFNLIPGPKPRERVELALYFISAICRDKILFAGPHAKVTRITNARLKEELTHMFLSYLGLSSTKPSKKKRILSRAQNTRRQSIE